MELGDVTAYARERLGMEVQAATLLGAQPAGGRRLEVWSLMTERGWFWFVEEGSAVELFRGAPGGAKSAGLVVRQFLELHPRERPAPSPSPSVGRSPGEYDCRRCEVRVTPHHRSAMVDRQLCRRCAHAERERERYRDDPEYRAHLLVRSGARHRAARGTGVR